MYTNVYGDKAGNNAGEYLAVDPNNGDVMVFVDSDTLGGAMGFLKLTSNGSPPTAAPPTTTSAPPITTTNGAPPTTTVGPPITTTVGPPTTTTVGPPTTTTTLPTTTTTESEGSEESEESENKCNRRKEKGKCSKKWVARNCQETCEKC